MRSHPELPMRWGSESGNGDLYGLGIRLDLYIQLLTLGVVFSLLPKSLYSSYFINTNISLFGYTGINIKTESALRDIPGLEINIFSILATARFRTTILLVPRHITMLPAISLASTLARILTSAYWT
ncbi:hypothetical protein IWW34DRAFT_796410 [Fusarium oxysporum f. sp. albedinis]|nr:hypothetical protein IWW34DRAFT_796410 [Fusarium oxysporum f. sp. albedinis]